PLYAYARRRLASADDAQEQTQEFFARLLEKEYLQAADPRRGKFRSFLLTAFKRFLAHERDRAHAQKRGGGRPGLPLDARAGEELGLSEQAVKVAVHRLRKRYGELLRAEIAQTVATPEEVQDELRDLFAAVRAPQSGQRV